MDPKKDLNAFNMLTSDGCKGWGMNSFEQLISLSHMYACSKFM